MENFGRDQSINNGPGHFEVNNVNIGHDLVQNFTATLSAAYKSLWDAVAGVGASHTSEQQYARGTCLEGIREKALRNIRDWSSDKVSLPLCWLSGTAGAGKSAITMSIAQSCESNGLVASFFFRSDPKRNNPSALAPTIALSLISKIPSLRTLIDDRIFRDPMILEAKLEDQFRELVLIPSLQMKRSGLESKSEEKFPNLDIIDGLDECSDEDTQLRILSIILSFYRQSPSAWSPLRFLICSRPEAWLREAFDREDLARLTHYVVLDNSYRDVKRYLRHEFQIIRATPKYSRLPFPSPWPSKRELAKLIQMASGQFAYAATAVKFVKLAYSNPLHQLRIILEYTPGNQIIDSPFPELDRLYHIVLSANPHREKLLSVLAAILILPAYVPPSPDFIEMLLVLTPGEVDLSLRVLHSVLDVRGGRDMIRVFHTSFSEYLFDRSRSEIFFIDRLAQIQLLARRWLQAQLRDSGSAGQYFVDSP
ncbi:hypothetical protein PQX77_000392 [Marasmius sp. AFHP31]|nr:hypothetical protein PQX77_000392 [Marasmius sp. AFHP31]